MEPPPQDAQSAFPPSTGLALTSLLLGLASAGLCFLVIGALPGIFGIVFGLVYLDKKRGPKGMARWGIGLSAFGILASIGFLVVYLHYFHEFTSNFTGGPAMAPTGALASPPPLPVASNLLKSNLVWSVTIPAAQALCAGDWENDGSARVLVAAGNILHILDLTGAEKSALQLPDQFQSIECGRSKSSGARMLGYSPITSGVFVVDHGGKTLWHEKAGMGLDGAHWGDLNGDGNDVMVIGMNGFGGLKVLSGDGKKLWSVGLGNVWSQAIIPPGTNRPGMVLATDAMGSVTLFDSVGNRTNTLRPEGGYYVHMAAGVIESNAVQILGFSQNAAVAFDLTGKTAWIGPAAANSGFGKAGAALGDIRGDDAKAWAYVAATGDLVLVTTGGQKVSEVAVSGTISAFTFARRPGQGDLLIILDNGTVSAYSFTL